MQLILGDQEGAQALQGAAVKQAAAKGGGEPTPAGIAAPSAEVPTEVTPPGLEGV